MSRTSSLRLVERVRDVVKYIWNENVEQQQSHISRILSRSTSVDPSLADSFRSTRPAVIHEPINIMDEWKDEPRGRPKTQVKPTVKRQPNGGFSHIAPSSGRTRMVDVSAKRISRRTATACSIVRVSPTISDALLNDTLVKGSALQTAEIAGIMAAKNTSLLIPHCHNIGVTGVEVTATLDHAANQVYIQSVVSSVGRTGVEMEALVAASTAALALYDMCKSVSHDIDVCNVKLLSKTGGASQTVECGQEELKDCNYVC